MYNPGISYDASPIARGFAGGIADIASAMVAKKEKDEQDKDFQARSRATEAFIKTHGPDIGWNSDQVKELLAPQIDETPRGRYLRLSDTVSQGVTGATLKHQQEQQKQQQDLGALRIDELKRQAAQGVTDRGALRNAFDPEMAGLAVQLKRPGLKFTGLDPNASVDDPLAAYTAQGGADPHTVAALAPLAKQLIRQQAKPAPRLVNLGTDSSGKPVEGVYDGANFRPLAADKTAAESQLGKLINERAAFKAAGNADAVKEYDRVIKNYGEKSNFLEALVASGQISPDAAAKLGLAPKEASAPANTTGKVDLPAKDQEALNWAKANPADPRAIAILKRLGEPK